MKYTLKTNIKIC